MEKIECHCEEELQHRKDMAMRAKCVVLELQGKSPLYNVSLMKFPEKKRFVQAVLLFMQENTEEQIIAQFNELICSTVLDENCDPSKLTCFQILHDPISEDTSPI